jgi:hypothetical protein
MIRSTAIQAGPTMSAQGWFAGGERVGYDPRARVIVAAQDAALKIFLRQEGDPAHIVSFLAGFPDGSFGWSNSAVFTESAAGNLARNVSENHLGVLSAVLTRDQNSPRCERSAEQLLM